MFTIGRLDCCLKRGVAVIVRVRLVVLLGFGYFFIFTVWFAGF